MAEQRTPRDLNYYPVGGTRRKSLTDEQVAQYNRDGFTFPVDVFSESEAAANLAYFDDILARAEAEGWNSYNVENWMRRCRGMFDLATHPKVLDIIEDLLGPNLVCFRCHYFAKLPTDVDEKTVTWCNWLSIAVLTRS
jgi:hypothetical protein